MQNDGGFLGGNVDYPPSIVMFEYPRHPISLAKLPQNVCFAFKALTKGFADSRSFWMVEIQSTTIETDGGALSHSRSGLPDLMVFSSWTHLVVEV